MSGLQCYAAGMRKLFSLILAFAMLASFGAVVHAAENVDPCARHTLSSGLDHWDKDGDQAPQDEDSRAPHHHGGCHGHHVGTMASRFALDWNGGNGGQAMMANPQPMMAMHPRMELRPPIG